ncbi:MAG: glycine oxidase ThiO [Pseudonocardiaceae bacterium]|nr:glycine oxidase ThiO [Pseudonocardiaceae bacterium]
MVPRNGSIAVVGGGVIGLSCAWRAAAAGFDVTVHDPAPGRGASHVAGGMLAPVTEAIPGEEDVLALGSASLLRWPDFAAELAVAAGREPGFRTEGTVVVAHDPADRAELDRLADYLTRVGREVEVLRGRALHRTEPALGPAVRHGLSVPGDLAVDNRALLAALLAACRQVGVQMQPSRCEALPAADVVVLAAGAHGGTLHPALGAAIRPVKGEILRLRARRGALPPPSRTVRAIVGGRQCYVVPRDGGRVVLGATQYEVGFDDAVTAGGVRCLLDDAERVLPAIAEYALEETSAGLRPGSPDNLPLIGELEPGVIAATGHNRNGILLAPLTADAVLALLRGTPVPPETRPADPARLTCGQVAKEQLTSADASQGSHPRSPGWRSEP